MWVETMSDVDEAVAAVQGAQGRGAGHPVIATMSFDTRGHTMMGVTPERAAEALLEAGAAAVGGNCGNGPEELIPVIERMRAAFPDAVLVAKGERRHADARRDGGQLRDDAGRRWPASRAGSAMPGANVIGACCGSTPPHLRAMAEAVRRGCPARPDHADRGRGQSSRWNQVLRLAVQAVRRRVGVDVDLARASSRS